MQAPSPLQRFAFVVLLGGLALVLILLGVLKNLPAPPRSKPAGAVQARPR